MVAGTYRPPADKSITHRSIFFAALSAKKSVIRNALLSGDCKSTIGCFRALGVPIQVQGRTVTVSSGNLNKNFPYRNFSAPKKKLDCGNSGTTMRLISGVLAAQAFSSVLTGDASLSKRPMRRVLDPLRKMGANIRAKDDNFAPLHIEPCANLHAIEWKSSVASAQVKSCVLLAGLFCDGKTVVQEPVLSRDHSERMLATLGVQLQRKGTRVSLQGRQKLGALHLTVPADFSSAAFFIVAALMVPGSNLVLKEVNLNPTRSGMLKVLKRMGAKILIRNQRQNDGEPIADIVVRYSALKATNVSAQEIPAMIDEVPVIALLATQAQGVTTIRGAEELRVKESNRLEAMAKNLSKMGAKIRETKDGLRIEGKTILKGAVVQSYDDHRIAMALAVAAQIAEGKTTIQNAECTHISFPSFYQDLNNLLHVK